MEPEISLIFISSPIPISQQYYGVNIMILLWAYWKALSICDNIKIKNKLSKPVQQ